MREEIENEIKVLKKRLADIEKELEHCNRPQEGELWIDNNGTKMAVIKEKGELQFMYANGVAWKVDYHPHYEDPNGVFRCIKVANKCDFAAIED